MMYKCTKCGKLFHEGEIKIISEATEDYRGMPCYEDREYSPCCKADFIPVETDDEFEEAEQ